VTSGSYTEHKEGSNGNQFIHRRLDKTESIIYMYVGKSNRLEVKIKGDRPNAGRQSDG